MENTDPMIRSSIPLHESTWDLIKVYQRREGIVTTAEALRRVLMVGLRALKLTEP